MKFLAVDIFVFHTYNAHTEACQYIQSSDFVVGAMSIKHLGGDAVYASVMGGGSGGDRTINPHHRPGHRGHCYHLYIYVCHLYQWGGQGR